MSSDNTRNRFERAMAAIDRLNAADPRPEVVDGQSRPRELVYAERMTSTLGALYPGASQHLQLAARAQHLCRWQIERGTFPMGREGYNAWRSACRAHHAALTQDVLRQEGYPEGEIAHVTRLICKQDLKSDRESQALENVVGVVFAAFYLAPFIAAHPDYAEDKLRGILRKTMRKLDKTDPSYKT